LDPHQRRRSYYIIEKQIKIRLKDLKKDLPDIKKVITFASRLIGASS
jgi:hypothetical protein